MYRTISDYKALVKSMSTRELDGLAETFNNSTTLTAKEQAIRNVINAEMETRIAQWEMM